METKEFFDVIGIVLRGETRKLELTCWNDVLTLARIHNLSQILVYAMNLNILSTTNDERMLSSLQNNYKQEVARSMNQMYAVEEMQDAFETYGIYNLAMKGACTKKLYPDEFLRTMGDIDILYKPEQHKLFKKIMNDLEYTGYQEGRKNDTYYREPYVCVEAHRQMVASKSKYFSYYLNIWKKAHPKTGYSYTYELSMEDELIFNIVHLAEHFKEGGAGVRFVMDVYVYNEQKLDEKYVEKELDELHLLEFYRNISAVADIWFGNLQQEADEIISQLADYILANGVFGDVDNSRNLSIVDGRFKFFLRTCFPAYADMCSMFPWLRGKPVLLPYSWGFRAIRSMIYRRDHVNSHIKTLRSGDYRKGEKLREFYSKCGL